MNRKFFIILSIILISIGGYFYAHKKPEPKLGAIDLALEGRSAKEKANIKANLVAQENLVGTYTENKYGETVEIQSVKKIEEGVEIIARAWKGANQIGFGKDGTVEWERFRIFNPPLLVDDPNGIIVRVWTDSDGRVKTRKLREDPKEAIKQVLAHTIKVSAKPGNKIIAGKMGNTSDTFFPTAGANNAGQHSVDGMVRRAAVDEVFTSIVNGTGFDAAPTAVSGNCVFLNSNPTTNQYGQLGRADFLFDTSPITANDTVDSATLSVDGGDVSKILTGGGIPTIGVSTSSPTSNSNLISSDYDIYESAFARYHMGSQLVSTGTIAISSWNEGSYNDFGLSATSSLGTIQVASTSKYALRIYEDLIKASSAPWADGGSNLVGCMFADNAGTTRDPKLVVEHSTIGGGTNTKRKNIIIID